MFTPSRCESKGRSADDPATTTLDQSIFTPGLLLVDGTVKCSMVYVPKPASVPVVSCSIQQAFEEEEKRCH
jgi:hypothetical protein